jgi:hypothetical protein
VNGKQAAATVVAQLVSVTSPSAVI